MPDEIIKAEDVVALLRNKFSEKQRYVVCEQVNEGTGSLGRSWIDVLVVNLWPSDGCSREAFEVKVSRSDWLKEHSNPEKNKWCRKFCHTFSYVCPKDIIKEAEIQDGCGLYYAQKSRLICVRAPKYNQKAVIDDVFSASLCRSIQIEFNKKTRDMRETLLNEDREIRVAIGWMKAAQTFLRKNHESPWVEKDYELTSQQIQDAVLKKLEEGATSDEAKKLKTIIQYRCDRLRDVMMNHLEAVAELSLISFAEFDSEGNRIIEQYGAKAETTLERMKAATKKKGYDQKNAAKALEMLTEFFKLAGLNKKGSGEPNVNNTK